MARSPSSERFKARLEAEAVKAYHANNPKAVELPFQHGHGINVTPTRAGQNGYAEKGRLNGLYVPISRSGRCESK